MGQSHFQELFLLSLALSLSLSLSLSIHGFISNCLGKSCTQTQVSPIILLLQKAVSWVSFLVVID